MVNNISSAAARRAEAPDTKGSKHDLPRNYGDTRIVALARDPVWLFVFWEVSRAALARLKERLGPGVFGLSRWKLRVYDATETDLEKPAESRYFDIDVADDADNWHIHTEVPNRSWRVELGMFTPKAGFIPVTVSKTVVMPRLGISPVTEEQWTMLLKDFERIFKLSGSDNAGKISLETISLMRKRWKELKGMSVGRYGGQQSAGVREAAGECTASALDERSI